MLHSFYIPFLGFVLFLFALLLGSGTTELNLSEIVLVVELIRGRLGQLADRGFSNILSSYVHFDDDVEKQLDATHFFLLSVRDTSRFVFVAGRVVFSLLAVPLSACTAGFRSFFFSIGSCEESEAGCTSELPLSRTRETVQSSHYCGFALPALLSVSIGFACTAEESSARDFSLRSSKS